MPPADSRLGAILNRAWRAVRRECAAFLRWLENTRNFIHFSLLLLIPPLIGLVTFLSKTVELLPFLLFPPLVSGAYTLFREPESRYASPGRFVGGMTLGAICGWVALELSAEYWYQVPSETFSLNPGAAAFGVLLTGVVTWALDLEESQAFSTALLVLVTGATQLIYVLSVFLSSVLVVGVFLVWRAELYEKRADYLYQTTHADDQVLIPMRGETAGTVATFGARIATAHEAGKLVLCRVVDDAERATSDTDRTASTAVDTDGGTVVRRGVPTAEAADTADDTDDLPPPARETAESLEAHAARLREEFDIPCEVVVAAGTAEDAEIITHTARETNCDLVVTPYETADGELTRFVRELFDSTLDVVVLRADGDHSEWRRILLPIKTHGEVAHAMLDFAQRLAGETSYISVCHCIDSERERRTAEGMVADLVETFDRAIETRVTTSQLAPFLSANADNYDLTIIGSSTDRSVVSRIVDSPTFEQLEAVDSDVAVVHRG